MTDKKKPIFEKPTPFVGPADLAELKATDAMLDRLAANLLNDADREDPLVAAFAELRVALDEPSDDIGLDVGRLIEVLGDRPLYLVDAEEAGDATAADSPINLGRAEPVAARTVVDVRDGALRHARPAGAHRPVAARQPAGQVTGVAGVAARVGDATSAAVGATVRSIHSITAGRRATHGRLDDDLRPRWQQVAQQVALPAASVVAMLVIGSGVSAAVTGNPMAPVAGMSKVVQQLPGINDGPSVESVQSSILAAGELAEQGQTGRATKVLDEAGKKIGDLPDEDQPKVQRQLADTKQKVREAEASPSAAPTVPVPAVTPGATPEPAASPSVTAPTTPDTTPTPSSPSPSSATASASASVAAATVPGP